jgi:hypothetical protein
MSSSWRPKADADNAQLALALADQLVPGDRVDQPRGQDLHRDQRSDQECGETEAETHGGGRQYRARSRSG